VRVATAPARRRADAFRAKLVDSLLDKRGWRVQTIAREQEVHLALAPRALWTGDRWVALAAVRDWTGGLKAATNKNFAKAQVPMPSAGESAAGVFEFSGRDVDPGDSDRSGGRLR